MKAININPKIKQILNFLINDIDHNVGIEAMILTGSASRSEETWFKFKDGREELFSDIEFLIVIKNRKVRGDVWNLMKSKISNIPFLYKNEFFKIEFGLRTKFELSYLDKRFLTFETKQCGKTFYGNDKIIDRIPDVTLRNLNWSELNSILIHRLYDVYSKYCKIISNKAKKILLARNLLDIPTVILPYEGLLIPTYRLRIEAFDLIKNRRLIKNFFSSKFYDHLRLAYNIKLQPNEFLNHISLKELHSTFLEGYKGLVNYLLYKGKKPFIYDKRALLRSFYSLSPKKIFIEVARPRLMKMAYSELIKGCSQFDYEAKDKIESLMRMLFPIYKKDNE
ncbi:MAG: hypothetical protein ACTSQP_22225 [Promethearchaeota archaeon]